MIARPLEGDGAAGDLVRLIITGEAAEARLDRAATMNALDPAMIQAIANAGARQNAPADAALFCAGVRFRHARSMILEIITPLSDD